MFGTKRNGADLIVMKKLPHTTAAVEAVSKLVCKIAEAAEGNENETVHIAMVLADITKRLAEVEKIVSFTEVPKPCTDGVAILRASSDCKRPFSERMARRDDDARVEA